MEVAAVATQMKSGVVGASKTMEIRWASRRDYGKLKSTKIPIFVSTNSCHINPQKLKELCSACNYSCLRFPQLDHNGVVVEAVDLKKLRVALLHSSVVVSVFCNSTDVIVQKNELRLKEEEEDEPPLMGFRDLLQRLPPLHVVSPNNSQLVGFGRAVSDFGLTASIYDVMNAYK